MYRISGRGKRDNINYKLLTNCMGFKTNSLIKGRNTHKKKTNLEVPSLCHTSSLSAFLP